MSLSIRKAQKTDAEQIEVLEQEAFPTSYWPLKQIEYELTTNPVAILLVVLDEDKVVGYLDFDITFDSATICRIAVRKDYRKKGIASSLLLAMENVLGKQPDKVSFITLEVRVSNVEARKLYQKMKYEEVTIKKKYYDDGEDAVYMVRYL